jgi:FlgD Ig-like domain
VARYASVALVAALLAATTAAFVVTENLKLTRSPILGTRVTKEFSPVCECKSDRALIRFRLREPDRISVDIVDGGEVVRELVREHSERGVVLVTWDGRDEAGEVVEEGSYRPRVRLVDERRTITLPNPIRVDTTKPVLKVLSLKPRVFSPDGDLRRDRTIARYRSDEPASAVLYVDGRRHTVLRGKRIEGRLDWNGKIGGEAVAQGMYRLSYSARDAAGNLARRTRPLPVVVRYVALGRGRIVTVAARRFAVLAASDAVRIEWRLGARRGVARPGTLRLRAPQRPGRYTLVVSANGRDDRAAVFVRFPPAAGQ